MITAVVVNWNGRHYLEACLGSLLAQEPPPDEVIVADNHSDDGSREWVAARFPQVLVVDTGRNGGPGLARNAGVAAAAAAHDRVLLVDNDVVLEPGALRSLSRTLDAHPEVALVQARALCDDRPEVVHYDAADLHYLGLLVVRNFFARLGEAAPPRNPVGAAVGLCALVRRDAYAAVGGFHEELFFYFEDTDFAWRLRLAGHELWCDADARVLHRGGTAALSLRQGAPMPAARIFYHSRNRWAVLLTCLRWRTLLATLPAQLVYDAAQLAFAASHGQALAWLRGKVALVRLLPVIGRWRRDAQRSRAACGRARRDRDLLVADPLTLHPGVADRGAAASVRRVLDRFFAAYWRIARVLCG